MPACPSHHSAFTGSQAERRTLEPSTNSTRRQHTRASLLLVGATSGRAPHWTVITHAPLTPLTLSWTRRSGGVEHVEQSRRHCISQPSRAERMYVYRLLYHRSLITHESSTRARQTLAELPPPPRTPFTRALARSFVRASNTMHSVASTNNHGVNKSWMSYGSRPGRQVSLKECSRKLLKAGMLSLPWALQKILSSLYARSIAISWRRRALCRQNFPGTHVRRGCWTLNANQSDS